MKALLPSASAGPFVGVENMMRRIPHVGLELCWAAHRPDAADFRALGEFRQDARRGEPFQRRRDRTHADFGRVGVQLQYVNGHPINAFGGLQTVAAFGLLAEVSTGYPVLLTEMTLLTALRTAATSAMAARHLPKGGTDDGHDRQRRAS